MERETGIEPATNSLGSCDSTTELLPLSSADSSSLTPLQKPLQFTPMGSAFPTAVLTCMVRGVPVSSTLDIDSIRDCSMMFQTFSESFVSGSLICRRPSHPVM
jgi:hypothetical protein